MVVVNLKGITENNKAEKLENLEKGLFCILNKQEYKQPKLNKSMFDDSEPIQDLTFRFHDFTKGKIEKALRAASFSLGVPIKSGKGEPFFWKLQEELTDRWCQVLSASSNKLYQMIIDYFDLPECTVVSKSVLTHKGKIIYNPSTGKPVTQAEWKKFVEFLQQSLDRTYSRTGKKIILDAVTLSKLLDRMAKYQTLDKIQNTKLNDLKYSNKTFDWISDNIKNMQDTFGEAFTRDEQARIQVMQQSAAQRITRVTDSLRNDIQQILIDGVKNREGKNKISQKLFDKMVGHNRDMQMIADTEIQNAANYAKIQEEVYNTPEGGKTYFQRVEIIDDNTCPFCKHINGKIAVYSKTPLESPEDIKDPIADYAIWDGMPYGKEQITDASFHPYCRGMWERYHPEQIQTNAVSSWIDGSKDAWNKAVEQAEKEFIDSGIAKPSYKTPGYQERIQEIYAQLKG